METWQKENKKSFSWTHGTQYKQASPYMLVLFLFCFLVNVKEMQVPCRLQVSWSMSRECRYPADILIHVKGMQVLCRYSNSCQGNWYAEISLFQVLDSDFPRVHHQGSLRLHQGAPLRRLLYMDGNHLFYIAIWIHHHLSVAIDKVSPKPENQWHKRKTGKTSHGTQVEWGSMLSTK